MNIELKYYNALYSGIETTIKMEYILSEYCDMLLILGQCNNETAARLYAESYPHICHPDSFIRRTETRLRKTDSAISIAQTLDVDEMCE